MNRNDRVALELHRAILKHLADDPVFVVSRALQNIERKRAASTGESREAVHTWETLLVNRDLDAIAAFLVADDEAGRMMRSSSVFQGILAPGERTRVLETTANAAE